MIRKILIITALVAIPFIGSAKDAQAEEYCREYTKTVSVGGRAEQAYGTACLRPDGSWEIVSLEGSDYGRDKVRDVMYDDIESRVDKRDRDRVVIVERYNKTPHYYRPYNRHHSVSISSFPFYFQLGNNYKRYSKAYSRNNHKYSRNARYVNNQKRYYNNRYSNNNRAHKKNVNWELRGNRNLNNR